MAKMSLLDMVQDILSDLNSDNVNSISDTVEAEQVARIIRSTFRNLYNDRVWPHTGSLLRLTSMADGNRPTHMKLLDDIEEIVWVKYDTRKQVSDPIKFVDVKYLEPSQFLDTVMARDADKDYAQVVIDIHGTPLIIHNNSMPTYWTMFDDEHIVFDSYLATMDSVLVEKKTQVFGYREPEFLLKDEFVPDIPLKMFPYFLSECKSVASLKVKEVFSQKDEQNSNRQKAWLSRNKRHGANGIRYPNYGRK
jgi:hypothetical protein